MSTSSVINNNKNNTSLLFYSNYIDEITVEKEHTTSQEFSRNQSFMEKFAGQESGDPFLISDFATYLQRLD